MILVKSIRNVALLTFCAAVLAVLGTGPVTGGGTKAVYSITELPGFAVGTYFTTVARAVNDPDAQGVLSIVGISSTVTGEKHPALWSATAAGAVLSLTDLGTLPGVEDPGAVAVNDGDLIVVTYRDDVSAHSPALVDVPGLGLIELPDGGGSPNAARGVNNLGEVVGTIRDAAGNPVGALWSIDNQGAVVGPVSLGTFFPWDINDLGVMAGEQVMPGTNAGVAAVAWFANGSLVVSELGLLAAGDVSSSAYAINNLGEVVGDSSGVGSRGFFWSKADGMIALGTLGGAQSWAYDINDHSQIVGGALRSTGDGAAFLWQNGKMSDLNTLAGAPNGQQLQYATGINNSGHIVGEMFIKKPVNDNFYQGFLLTPKP